jgi:hypothetical protein
MAVKSLLDNIVWHALSGRQSVFSAGGSHAPLCAGLLADRRVRRPG